MSLNQILLLRAYRRLLKAAEAIMRASCHLERARGIIEAPLSGSKSALS